MLFNSYIFVLLFLPVVVLGYFTLNHFRYYRLAMLLLLGMSLWFYGYFNYTYLVIIIGSIILNYLVYRLFNRYRHSPTILKSLFMMAIIINIGMLFYFKYFDFFIENANMILKTAFPLKNIVLPLGISFFTFQQVSFVIDAYKNEVPEYDFLNYACFVTYFPQLVAGPIVTHDELVPQFADKQKKKFNWDNFTPGLIIFTFGLSKKVLIADVIGNAVNWGYNNIELLDSGAAIIVMIAYTIQIYFDFSGYSDMAIGMGKMMNIDLPMNFNSPYHALDINDFWKRWHITLTRFFTKYIYIPLGGNRKGTVRTYLNIFVVYLISGIWHGANWTFILWGICHGSACILYRCFKKIFDRIPRVIRWLSTFSFVNIMWIFFRADSISDALEIIQCIFSGVFHALPQELIDSIMTAEWNFISSQIGLADNQKIIFLIGYILFSIAIVFAKNIHERQIIQKPTMLINVCTAFLLFWCIMSFAGVSTFLYFNF